MGKKKGKKVSGAEKTAQKTQKNAEKKAKKELRKAGEKDIEDLIEEFKEQDRKKLEVQEIKCPRPSYRCNMSFTAHPDKDELIMYGGEYDTGTKTFVYNDLFYYNLKSKEWTLVSSPNPPPPRCSHQAVTLKQGGGQLWIFGGEFVSPSQSQFHHWKDLWVLHLKSKRWEKIGASGGPSSRSGHRMVALKKQLLVFGGFYDNTRDCKYFSDVYSFNLETYRWSKLEPKGQGPCPRSGCQMLVNREQTGVLIYGGYSKEKVKKDVDIGHTHSDMFMLIMDTKKEGEIFWRWQPVKQSGTRPSPRSGMSAVSLPTGMAFIFGGVYDEEESEEEVKGLFYDEMFTLETDKGKWHNVWLKGKKGDGEERKKRRKKEDDERKHKILKGEDSKDTQDKDSQNVDTEQETMETEDKPIVETIEQTESPADKSQTESDLTTIDDGIFRVTIGAASTDTEEGDGDSSKVILKTHAADVLIPSARMSALMTTKHSTVYLYGGIYEEGDKQVTYDDMYMLDLHKMDTWTMLESATVNAQKWEESDSSDNEENIDDVDDDEDDDDTNEECEGAVGYG